MHCKVVIHTKVGVELNMAYHRTFSTLFPVLIAVIYFLADLSLTRGFNQRSFRPVTDAFGESRFCANDVPSSVIMVNDIIGLPQGVPDVVRCSYFCTSQSSCSSFNIRQGSPRQCEGFNFIPRNCSVTKPDNCQHFEVTHRISF